MVLDESLAAALAAGTESPTSSAPTTIDEWVAQLAEIAAVRPSVAQRARQLGQQLAPDPAVATVRERLDQIAIDAENLESQHFFTALRVANLQLSNRTDAITDGLNERGIEHHLRHTLAPFVFKEQRAVALMYLDLAGFKEINDTFGHDVGDEVLAETDRRLRHAIRSPGTVGRVGGNRFLAAVIADDGRVIDEVLDRFRVELGQPFVTREHKQISGWSFSYGVRVVDPPAVHRHLSVLDAFNAFASHLAHRSTRDDAQRTMLRSKGVDAERIDLIVDAIEPLVPRGLESGTQAWADAVRAIDAALPSVAKRIRTLGAEPLPTAYAPLLLDLHRLADDADHEAHTHLQAELQREELEIAMVHDELTGHYNANGFERHVRTVLAPFAMREGLTVALTYADVSGMGGLNERYGSAVVDAVLREVHERIDRVTKRPGVVARDHGDEFILANPVTGSLTGRDAEIRQIESRVRSALSRPYSVELNGTTHEVPGVQIKLGTVPLGPPVFEHGIPAADQVAAFATEVLDPSNKSAAEHLMYLDGARQREARSVGK